MSNPKQKKNVRADFSKAKLALKEVMQENLSLIAQDMIDQVILNVKRSTPSQEVNATKGVSIRGTQSYKDSLRNALSVVCLDAMDKARKEVPSKKNIRLADWGDDSLTLAEFDRLPPKIQKKILNQSSLLIDTQGSDLEKAVYFQFGHSLDSTDSVEVLQQDLEDAADDYITGSSVEAASGTGAAQMINESRNAFFFTDEVLNEIEAFQFVNGDPVSPICQDLAGTIFAKDDPEADRYYPPLHYNCKSFIVPILTGNLGSDQIEKLRPSSAKLEKFINLAENN